MAVGNHIDSTENLGKYEGKVIQSRGKAHPNPLQSSSLLRMARIEKREKLTMGILDGGFLVVTHDPPVDTGDLSD